MKNETRKWEREACSAFGIPSKNFEDPRVTQKVSKLAEDSCEGAYLILSYSDHIQLQLVGVNSHTNLSQSSTTPGTNETLQLININFNAHKPQPIFVNTA